MPEHSRVSSSSFSQPKPTSMSEQSSPSYGEKVKLACSKNWVDINNSFSKTHINNMGCQNRAVKVTVKKPLQMSQLQNSSAGKIALLKQLATAPPHLPSCASRRRRGSDRLSPSSQDALKSSIFHCRGVLQLPQIANPNIKISKKPTTASAQPSSPFSNTLRRSYEWLKKHPFISVAVILAGGYVIKYLSQTPLKPYKMKPEEFLKCPSKDREWRLFIDKARQWENNPLVFDKEEPGYFAGMSGCFDLMKRTLGDPVTPEYLATLHDTCIDNVKNEAGNPFKKGFQSGTDGWHYGFVTSLLTNTAKNEWQTQRLICNTLDCLSNSDYLARCNDSCSQIFSNAHDAKHIVSTLTNLLKNYYEEISQSSTDDQKLSAIANLCRSIEIFHPFPDANLRTVVFALLPKLLLQNGFSPTILDDPKMFEGYQGTDELVTTIIQGQNNFESMVGATCHYLPGR